MRRGFALLLVAAIAFCLRASAAEPSPSPAAEARSPLQLRAALSHSGYTSATRLLLKVDYDSTAGTRQERPQLNIALVLDSSGSMAADQKLKYTIDAARSVIENLSDRDSIALIAFNERVTVLSPAGRVVNKSFLFHRLEEVAPAGFTDISAALLEGIAQIKTQRAEGQIRQVLLLTDGMANRGVTTSTAMRRIAEKAQADGIGLSTLGCGTEFNEKRLTELAAAGGGRYTYISAPEQIPVAFEQELRGLLDAAAQNVRLEISLKGAAIVKINGQPLDKPVSAQKFEIGNLRSGERGLFLMELKPERAEAGAAVETSARITFDDAQSAQRLTSEAQARAPAMNQEQIRENAGVILYGEVLDALTLAEEAAKGMDAEIYKRAQASFAATYDKARQYAIANQDQELLNQTFLLKHFTEEFAAAKNRGLLHEHRDARAKFQKEADYRRYLLNHHRGGSHASPEHD